MPRIRMRTLAAGPEGARYPGVEYVVSQQDAKDLVSGGYADLLSPSEARGPEAVETAAAPPAETAAARPRRQRGGA